MSPEITRKVAALAVAAAVLGGCAYGATANVEADPLLQQYAEGTVQLLTADDNTTTILKFPAMYDRYGNPKRRELTTITVGIDTGAFTGNYDAAGIKSLSFKLASNENVPFELCAVLKSGSYTWVYNAVTTALYDAFGANSIPLSPDALPAGWDVAAPRGTDKNALWQQCLTDVDSVGIRASVVGPEEHLVYIRDFVLVDNDGTTYEGELTLLAQRLRNAFGVERMADVTNGSDDQDGDGLSDLQEVVIGSDREDAASGLAAVIVERTAVSVTIKWQAGPEDVSYRVERTDSLGAPFVMVGNGLANGVDGATLVDGELIWTDTQDVSPEASYFYRVIAVVPEEVQ